jgi:hypothetical protein
LVPAGEGEGEGEEASAALHQHLLVEFALSLLQGALRKGIINPRAPGAGVDAVQLLRCGMSPALSMPLHADAVRSSGSSSLQVAGAAAQQSSSAISSPACLLPIHPP